MSVERTDTGVEKNLGGRPTKYKPEFCERVVELGMLGKSRFQIARDLGVAMSTMQDWEVAHDEFRAATTHARDLAQAWWEDQGQKGIWSKEFNQGAFAKQISCRFPDSYTEKRLNEHTGKDGAPLNMWGVPVETK